MSILKSFFLIWTSPISKEEKSEFRNEFIGKSQIGMNQFLKSLEVI